MPTSKIFTQRLIFFNQRIYLPLNMTQKSRTYHYFLFFLTVFLLLFVGAMRVDPWIALVLAFVDTCWMTLMLFGLERYLEYVNRKKMPRLLAMLTTSCFLVAFVSLLMLTEDIVLRLMLRDHFQRSPFIYPLFRNSMLVMGAYLGATGIRARKIRIQSENLIQEKQDMELTLLKSRMDPHFVFNALNVLYSLSYTRSEKTPEMIMKLAEMLHYIIDECQVDKVPIAREVQYIENYLGFQGMRYGEIANLRFTHIVDDARAEIPPMILQPFIENSFKHGDMTSNPAGKITISLLVENKRLLFTVVNTKGKANEQNFEREGLGVSNVERRLKLYYPGKHSLEMQRTEKEYLVTLKIEL
ncbi:MAG: Sensor histidine kinase YpdA [Bacteroidetes bacterium ADurb.Bin139]|nr:MAG: Sensor histidine kinase YpdA [Bacteroidetes bacterium ADurb.Bin139]